MANAIQALFPIYLPRSRKEEQTTQDYDVYVSQNEANLNQDLELLYNQMTALTGLAERQAATIEAQSIIIQQLQEAINHG